MEMMHIGSAAAFDKLVQSSEKPVLVDFWATWCGPCRMLAPVIEDLAAEHPEIQFAKLDVDQVPDVAMRFGVSGHPYGGPVQGWQRSPALCRRGTQECLRRGHCCFIIERKTLHEKDFFCRARLQ